MQKILTAMATEGMVLARDVETSEGRVLCGKGTELSARLIERLGQMEIAHVTVEGHPLEIDGEKTLEEELRDVEIRFCRVADTPPLMYLKRKITENLIAARECMMQEEKQYYFRQALRDVKNLPTLPGIVIKLTAMAEDPDTTTEQMGKVISKDHILAAKLLKLVNSAFYGFPQRISSLSSAIILLGFNVIKSLIISASIFELMEDNDVELWEHSLGCAVACNVLAKRLGVSDPEEISTAGLIHDIGKVAIKMELGAEYKQIQQMAQEREISMREAELEILGLDHAEVGGWLAKTWNLPAKLVEPVAMHHDPGAATNENMAAAIVHFANIMIRGMGYGHGADVWVPPLDNTAWQLLALTPPDIDEILVEVEEKLWEVKGFSLDIQSEFDSRTT